MKLIFKFRYLIGMLCAAAFIGPVLGAQSKSNQQPLNNWNITESNRKQIQLSFQKDQNMGLGYSQQTIVLAVFPDRDAKVEIKSGQFILFPENSLDKTTVDWASDTVLQKEYPIRIENLGWARDFRVGRVIVPVSIHYKGMTGTLQNAVINLTPSEVSVPETLLASSPSKAGTGMEPVFQDMLANYEYNSPLRALPVEQWKDASNIPGMGAPDLLNTSMNWLRVIVKESGLQHIPLNELESFGFKLDKDKDNLMIYKNSQSVQFPRELLNNGELVFYGDIPDTPYTATQTYWLTWNKSAGSEISRMKIPALTGDVNLLKVRDYQDATKTYEENIVYDDNPIISGSGKTRWYWASLSTQTTATIRLNIKDTEGVEQCPDSIQVEVQMVGKNKAGNINHVVAMTWDGVNVGQSNWTGTSEFTYKANLTPIQVKPGFHQISFILKVTTPASQNDEVFMDNLTLKYRYPLGSGNRDYLVQRSESDSLVGAYRLKNYPDGATPIYALDTNGHLFPADIRREGADGYLVARPDITAYLKGLSEDAYQPEVLVYQTGANLRDIRQQADYLIITHSDFLVQAQRLADYRKKQGLNVKVINVQDIYDQFSGGNLSPQAIKDFVRYTVGFWKRPTPGYIVFLGDGTSDYKEKNHNGVVNYIPPYRMFILAEESASDLWYTQVAGKDHFPDIILGRISVNNVEDVESILKKTINYEIQPEKGIWKNRVLLIADDGFEEDTREMATLLPPSIFRKFLNLKDYPFIDNYYLPTGEDSKISPEANQAIIDAISDGDYQIIYFGHGSPNVWGHERMLFGGDSRNSDMKKLTNGRKLPFVVKLTCSTGQFDWPSRPWNICITEDMHRVSNGGAIALYSPTGKGFTPQHKALTRKLIYSMYDNNRYQLGQAVMESAFSYFLLENADITPQMYILFGDPALTLYPESPVKPVLVTPQYFDRASTVSFTVNASDLPIKSGQAYIQSEINYDLFSNQINPKAYCMDTQVSVNSGRFSAPINFPVAASVITVPVRFYSDDPVSGPISGYAEITAKLNQVEMSLKPAVVSGSSWKVSGEILNTGTQDLNAVQLRIAVDDKQIQTLNLNGLKLKQKQSFEVAVPQASGIHSLWVTTQLPGGYELETTHQILSVPDGKIYVPDADVALSPEILIGGTPQEIQFVIHNLSNKTYAESTAQLIRGVGGVIIEKVFPALKPLSQTTVNWSWTVPGDTQLLQLSLNWQGTTYWSRRVPVLGPPDMTIDTTMSKFTKAEYNEGETVFLDLAVKNIGQSTGRNIEVTAIDNAQGQTVIGRPLNNRTDWRTPVISEIPAGETRMIRLRWDASQNAGQRNITITLDRLSKTSETNRSNNQTSFSFNVLSKPQLTIVKTEWNKATTELTGLPHDRTVFLRSIIANLGQQAAENVVVQFFDHNTKIGNEQDIPLLKYGEQKAVEVLWDMPRGQHNVHVEVGMKSRYDKASNNLVGIGTE